MSQKTSKKKSQISRGKNKKMKQATQNPTPWPNLPHQITALLARQPNLMQSITSFGCVIKSWRSSPKQCSKVGSLPHLVEIDLKDPARSHVVEIPFHEDQLLYRYYIVYKSYIKRRSYNKHNDYFCPGIHFKGFSHGYVIVMDAHTPNLYLWEPAGPFTEYRLRWVPNLPLKTSVLSSFGKYPSGSTAMVTTGMCSPAFAFYRWGEGMDTAWTVQDCIIEEPYALGQCMKFTNAIGHRGKFYALSLQGSVAVIEDVGLGFEITAVGANRAVPSGLSRQFREYLVEVDGEILLVLLVSRKSIDVVDDVEAFRLDVGRLLWVKMGSMGDKALFVEDECCMGVIARDVGCKSNCVYFSHGRVDSWWMFDMGSGQILPVSRCSDGIQEVMV